MTVDKQPLQQLEQNDAFIQRHIGPDQADKQAMLATLGVDTLAQLIDQTVPQSIRLKQPLMLGESMTEQDALATLKKMAAKNKVFKSYIGMGYHNTITPNVILRNVLENPGWYTAYTPYQPEISQGRLEGLLNFQQMVMDLTGMDLANASLLDEATAAAEAMTLCKRSNRKKTNSFFVAEDVHPQTIDVIKTRAEYFGFDIVVGNPYQDLAKHEVFGVLLQYPTTEGDIGDISAVIQAAQQQKAMTVVAADIMSLVLLKSPGELGADVVIGSAQRFGVPMGYGGPHAAFFATRDKFKRSTPGRIIGVSKDTRGELALRMAMQTREQHIRREKATSNICTAQALLANMAGFYVVYHGPAGLKTIATRIHRLTAILAAGLAAKGAERVNEQYFDTITLNTANQTDAIYQRALAEQVNLRKVGDDKISIALDETTTAEDVQQLWSIILGADHGQQVADWDQQLADQGLAGIASAYQRSDAILTHPVFNQHHSETEMLRYLKQLENKDISLTHSMIPLGSCTMKLNATAEMIPVTWPEFSQIHPFAPKDQTVGYQEMLQQLADWLIEMTGYDALSHQPNSGAQGEYAGLLAISAYHKANGNSHRNVCLIPSSAHGTNPASASMLGMEVVIVDCDDNGNVDLADLATKAEKYADKLSCIMITYPSTHGVYEEGVQEICRIVHQYGGQVYLDGANLNAQVGLTSPGFIGADVSHLNLHKTFCIPHGGGGPGMGPIGVKAHLAPYLPNHAVNSVDEALGNNGAVSAAPFGSASILPISWVYIALMGTEGMCQATAVAILNANYITEQLSAHYPVLYRGSNGRVAHECIIDVRPIKAETGISEEDVAKRLMDFGFHAPTMSFPVPGTLMIEPTESESKAELDRFINAMITIRQEINKVAAGEWQADNNPLVNAPHTLADITDTEWNRPYTREEAVFPLSWLKQQKVWPTTNRIDNVYGDRNLVCSCPTTDSYRTE